MKKRVNLSIISVLVLVAIFVLIPGTEASFWVKGSAFHYCPNYGDLKDGLDKAAPSYDVWKNLSPGTGLALSVGYDFTKNWGVRLDTFKFTGIAEYHHLHLPDIFYFETSTSPILLSIVYQVLPQSKLGYYLGAGIGKFPSELAITWNPRLDYSVTWTCSDCPIAWQVLAGTEYRFKGFLLSSEVRYLSAKAEYPEYRCLEFWALQPSTDWSGLFVSFGVRVNI